MNTKQEIVPIKLEAKEPSTRSSQDKLAIQVTFANQEVLIYNGANNYLIQTVLRELATRVS